MSTTVMLTGLLPFIVLVASVLAVPTSLLLLRLYRSAVQKGMRSAGGSPVPVPDRPAVHRTPLSALRIQAFDASSHAQGDLGPPAYRKARDGRWQTAAVYSAAGASFAVIMTAGWLAATHDQALVWIKLLLLFWSYLWPTVIAVVLVAAYDRPSRLQLFAAYFIGLLAIAAVAAARNPGTGLGQLFLYWIIENGPPTGLVLAFLLRPIRAVGPLVLAFLIAVAIGSQFLLSVASANEGLLRLVAGIGFRLGLSAGAMFSCLIVLGMLVFGALGWPLLRFLGKRYEQKRASDQSIMLDALWLLFGVVQSVGLAFESPPWILTGLVAFIGYKLVTGVGFRLSAAAHPAGDPRTLLLLRVFALGKRSERLFDKLRKHWPYAGSMSMIAGPDLVTATIEPHEFLAFVSGRLGRQFVSDARDLEHRIAVVDKRPDPDGRCRINEFFCRNDTWQMTMERLAAMSDAVLMDLRSFSPANRGCIFELGRLLDGIDLRRVVFLVDDTTDQGFLESTLQDLWQNLDAGSPNQTAPVPTVRLFHTKVQSRRELGALLRLLTGPAPAPMSP